MRIMIASDKKRNLCDTCLNNFAVCQPTFTSFGSGLGNDNVIKCSSFICNTENYAGVEVGSVAPKFKKEINYKSHDDLVQIGYRWLLRAKPRNCLPMYGSCSVAFKELVTVNIEIPDLIGFHSSSSVLIECKANRPDFLKDKNKVFRNCQALGMGEYRFYLTNENVININELPDKWGLLIAKNNNVKIIKDPIRFDDFNMRAERIFLTSIIKRISSIKLLDCINEQRFKAMPIEFDSDEGK